MGFPKLLCVVWPAFLAACVLEMLVFAVVDPENLYWFGHPLALSNQSVYSLAFFAFWLICGGAAGLTSFLMQPGEPSCAVNDRSAG